MTRLDDRESATPEQLRDKLEKLFANHVAEAEFCKKPKIFDSESHSSGESTTTKPDGCPSPVNR
jgi:hypothetical protein